ncbi:MAG: alanine--tRNA ligase [Weeksellaceae bacterium]
MAITHIELRHKFATFWESRGHKEVPAITLVPQNDPTTLFTGSGMQQFVPNLLGEPHPQGNRLYNIQPCLRAQDIEEVGDNRHTTAFEMMGNWSLGDYFKKDQLNWLFEFFTKELGLDPHKLYVSVFAGEGNLPADDASIEIWKEIYKKYNIDAKVGERIVKYDAKKNWWSRGGPPDTTPVGDPCGPDSEVFYDFGEEYKFHENSAWKDEACHMNCDCGRYIEIGNSVFMQYRKEGQGNFKELENKNVDFGGGLERILAACYDNPDVFMTDLYQKIIAITEKISGKSYSEESNKPMMRIIADHMKAAVFVIHAGVLPSNKEHGYVLRRLLRRSMVKMYTLRGQMTTAAEFTKIAEAILETYDGIQGIDKAAEASHVISVISNEMERFGKSLDRGLKEIKKMDTVDAKAAFDLYQSYGFPVEITEELLQEKGLSINKEEFRAEFDKHRDLSRSSSAGKFKGGLADSSDQTLKYHTATHLLHQALHDVLGDSVRQEGSNITPERLRFDFFAETKLSDEQVKQVEQIINGKIEAALPVAFEVLPKADAEKLGARSFFKEKYPDMVKVYFIGSDKDHMADAYSKEYCGGPHVSNTKDIGKLTLSKYKTIGANMYRIYAE